MRALYLLRAWLLYLLLIVGVAVGALTMVLVWPLPFPMRFKIANFFIHWCIFWMRVMVGIRHRVIGKENIPEGPFVLMPRHSSAWETLVFQSLFPPYCWVLKRELLWIPIFGWGVRALRAIAINRSAHRKAVTQMLSEGRKRIAKGCGVLVFPEGTRMAAGQTRRFGLGGAILACDNGVPVLPVAHNAGVFWPRRQLVQGPATIDVEIGEPIETQGRSPEEVTAQAKTWVDQRVAVLEAEAIARR